MPVHWLFRFDSAAAVAAWRAVDDRVMGGVSRSRLRFDPAGHAVFEGEVSLDQGGGFASVRAAVAAPAAATASDLVVEARGDGRQYKLSLFVDEAFDAPAYQATLAPPVDTWQVLALPLAGFVPRFRGRAVAGAAALEPACIRQVGLLIADRQAGPFALQLRTIGLR